jgi:hypothetical protein
LPTRPERWSRVAPIREDLFLKRFHFDFKRASICLQGVFILILKETQFAYNARTGGGLSCCKSAIARSAINRTRRRSVRAGTIEARCRRSNARRARRQLSIHEHSGSLASRVPRVVLVRTVLLQLVLHFVASPPLIPRSLPPSRPSAACPPTL